MFHKKKWSLDVTDIALECAQLVEFPETQSTSADDKPLFPPSEEDLETINRLRTAVSANPNIFSLAFMLGLGCMETGMVEDALSAFKLAASLRPDDPRPNFHLADIYYQAAAVDLFRDALPSAALSDIQSAASVDDDYDSFLREISKRAVAAVNMDAEDAARTAVTLFKKTLSCGLIERDKEWVGRRMSALLPFARSKGWAL